MQRWYVIEFGTSTYSSGIGHRFYRSGSGFIGPFDSEDEAWHYVQDYTNAVNAAVGLINDARVNDGLITLPLTRPSMFPSPRAPFSQVAARRHPVLALALLVAVAIAMGVGTMLWLHGRP